jgi:cell division protein FtsB
MMSADCSKCGCDLTLDENYNYVCHYCRQEKEIEQLKARILELEKEINELRSYQN